MIRALLARVKLDPKKVEDLVLGCAMPEGEQGLNVARVAGFLGGLPEETSAMTINRFCSSGLQAIALAAGAIAFGSNDLVIAGGVESMTMVPMTGNKISASPEADGGEFPIGPYTPMGITAENVAKRFEVSRAEQDKFALSSQEKAAAAQKANKFKDEIVPVSAVRYEKNERVMKPFLVDELVRADTTLEGLSGAEAGTFSTHGSVTAGNASPLSDGAAAAIVASAAKADALKLPRLGYLRSFVTVGVDPSIMGIGPIPAIQKLLAKNGLTVKDIDLFEVNEAFASQAFHVQRTLGLPDEKLNVNGGAIALGHPLGCTGAKLTATLLHELKRRGGRYGVVSMCIGGGMGAAGLFELASEEPERFGATQNVPAFAFLDREIPQSVRVCFSRSPNPSTRWRLPFSIAESLNAFAFCLFRSPNPSTHPRLSFGNRKSSAAQDLNRGAPGFAAKVRHRARTGRCGKVARMIRRTNAFALIGLISLAALGAASCGGGTAAPQLSNVKAGEMPSGGSWSAEYYSEDIGTIELVTKGDEATGKWQRPHKDTWGEFNDDGNVIKIAWHEYDLGCVEAELRRERQRRARLQPGGSSVDDVIDGSLGKHNDEVSCRTSAKKQRNVAVTTSARSGPERRRATCRAAVGQRLEHRAREARRPRAPELTAVPARPAHPSRVAAS